MGLVKGTVAFSQIKCLFRVEICAFCQPEDITCSFCSFIMIYCAAAVTWRILPPEQLPTASNWFAQFLPVSLQISGGFESLKYLVLLWGT